MIVSNKHSIKRVWKRKFKSAVSNNSNLENQIPWDTANAKVILISSKELWHVLVMNLGLRNWSQTLEVKVIGTSE